MEPVFNDVIFATQGDWDSTTLANNGVDVAANRLFVHFQQTIDQKGFRSGGELSASIVTQADPNEEAGIFPGTLTIDVPNHKIVIENKDPHFGFAATKVVYQDIEVTEYLVEFHLEVDAAANVVQAYITLFQGADATDNPVQTFNVL